MTKCTFCGPRLEEGLDPACVTLCPTGALTHGEVAGLEGAPGVPGFPESAAAPSIRFVQLRGNGSVPETSLAPLPVGGSDPRDAPEPERIGLAWEWPLFVLTLVAAGLVGWLGAALLGEATVDPAAFLVPAAVAMALSTAHLGRKERAWRAVLGIRTSWLSREITAFSAFVGATALYFLTGRGVLGMLGLALGAAALFAMDRVYDVVRREGRLHSADVLLTGLLLLGTIAALPVIAGTVGLAKLALYLTRGRRPVPVAIVRVGAGLVLPGAMWILTGEAGPVVLGLVLLGEIVDRLEFYERGLRPRSPRSQALADLEAMISHGPRE